MSASVPPGFPWNTVQVQRALTVIKSIKPQLYPDVIAELYRLMWVESENVHTLEQAKPVFNKILGKVATEEVMQKVCSISAPRLIG